MTKRDLPALSIIELRDFLRRGEISPGETLRALEERINAVDSEIGAYLAHDFATAISEAKRADVSLPLGGVPIAIKDLINVEGQQCSCASKILRGYRAPYSATVIEKLRGHGAIPFGRMNMDEFAMGSSTENSSVQVTRNPWDLSRVPGGSSGGPAAAVAAGLAAGSLGTDTGGSIRQPAAFCGVVGLKPTYGRVSRYGLVAFASSLDHPGPFGSDVTDTALLLGAIAGHDPMDATSIDAPVPDYAAGLEREVRGLRLGVPDEYFTAGMDPEVERAVRAAIDVLEGLGATLERISLPATPHALATYYVIAPAEASSNLARYDGVKYGLRVPGHDLIDMESKTRAAGFGAEVKRRIMLGTYVLSAGYYDAYYGQAQKVRTLVRRDFDAAFGRVDLIVAPTTPNVPFRRGEKAEPIAMYLNDVFTIPADMSGVPAVSVPCGFTASGLPIGLQLIGRVLDEATVLRAARAYERATDWHTRRPELA